MDFFPQLQSHFDEMNELEDHELTNLTVNLIENKKLTGNIIMTIDGHIDIG